MSTVSYIALETVWNKLDDPTRYSSAEEAFHMFTALLDTGIRIFHNIRISMHSSAPGIRRSELRAFHHDNHYAWKEFIDQKNLALLTKKVPLPTGMSCTYKEAIDKIEEQLEHLNIDATLSAAQSYLTQLSHEIKDGDVTHLTKKTQEAFHQLKLVSRDDIHHFIKSILPEISPEIEKPASQVLKSYPEIVTVDEKILGLEKFYQKITHHSQQLDQIEKTLNTMIDTIKGRDLPRELLTAVHKFIFSVAVQFDMLGAVAHISQMLEHNFALAMKKLINEH